MQLETIRIMTEARVPAIGQKPSVLGRIAKDMAICPLFEDCQRPAARAEFRLPSIQKIVSVGKSRRYLVNVGRGTYSLTAEFWQTIGHRHDLIPVGESHRVGFPLVPILNQ